MVSPVAWWTTLSSQTSPENSGPQNRYRWFSWQGSLAEFAYSFWGGSPHYFQNLATPRRLTWNIIMEVWKIMFLSKWVICRFHVNLPGCSCKQFGKSWWAHDSLKIGLQDLVIWWWIFPHSTGHEERPNSWCDISPLSTGTFESMSFFFQRLYMLVPFPEGYSLIL